MADAEHKFLSLVAGVKKLLEPIITSGGATDGGKMVKTDPTTGKLDPTVIPTASGGSDSESIEASENMTAPKAVNLWDDGGVTKVRMANASDSTKPCHGYILDTVTSGNNVTVYYDDKVTGLTGKTRGATQYLSTTSGEFTETAPSADGQVIQPLGFASDTTAISFERGEPAVIELL